MPSFFGMQTYYWGDWHRDVTLGKERAYRWDPAQSALRRGMIFTSTMMRRWPFPTRPRSCRPRSTAPAAPAM